MISPHSSRLKPYIWCLKAISNPSTWILVNDENSTDVQQLHPPYPPDVVPPEAPARLFGRSPAELWAPLRPERWRERWRELDLELDPIDQIHKNDHENWIFDEESLDVLDTDT